MRIKKPKHSLSIDTFSKLSKRDIQDICICLFMASFPITLVTLICIASIRDNILEPGMIVFSMACLYIVYVTGTHIYNVLNRARQ